METIFIIVAAATAKVLAGTAMSRHDLKLKKISGGDGW